MGAFERDQYLEKLAKDKAANEKKQSKEPKADKAGLAADLFASEEEETEPPAKVKKTSGSKMNVMDNTLNEISGRLEDLEATHVIQDEHIALLETNENATRADIAKLDTKVNLLLDHLISNQNDGEQAQPEPKAKKPKSEAKVEKKKLTAAEKKTAAMKMNKAV